MKKVILSVAAVAVFLTGCYSFNHIVLPKDDKSSAVKEVAKDIVREAGHQEPLRTAEQMGEKQCEMYILPAYSSTPELPFDDILKADKNNPRALDKIQSEHIEELRDYIARFKSEIRASHNEYLRKCYRDNGLKLPRTN